MIILQVLVLVVFIVVIYRLLSGWGGRLRGRSGAGGRGRYRCADCRHLLTSYDDGVSCGFGGKQVFKNPVHISNCMDHEPRDP